jgi:hypothetical protein
MTKRQTQPPSKLVMSSETKATITKAIEWLLSDEGKGKEPVTTTHNFCLENCYANTVHIRVKRAIERTKNQKGLYNKHSGKNKILDSLQEEVIIAYTRDHVGPGGMGITKSMIRMAIEYMLSQQTIPQQPPSAQWFND